MLKQRFVTAMVLIPLMVAMLFWSGDTVWLWFSGLIAITALWEYTRLVGQSAEQVLQRQQAWQAAHALQTQPA